MIVNKKWHPQPIYIQNIQHTTSSIHSLRTQTFTATHTYKSSEFHNIKRRRQINDELSTHLDRTTNKLWNSKMWKEDSDINQCVTFRRKKWIKNRNKIQSKCSGSPSTSAFYVLRVSFEQRICIKINVNRKQRDRNQK